MKKIILFLVVMGMLNSCGTSKTVRTSKKIIKGAWALNEITFDNYGTFRITFFDDVTKTCLEGSNWKFIPNNNTGKYIITGVNCVTGARNFIFIIDEIDPETGLYDFLIKPTDVKEKSLDNTGFRLGLSHLSDTKMKWQQKASIDGKTITMNLNFSKINE